MTKIAENDVELLAIQELEKLGYRFLHGPDISPDGETPERESYEHVCLYARLKQAIDRINPDVPPDAREDALKQVLRLRSTDLLTNNETFHHYLTEGVNVTYQVGENPRGALVWLIDYKNPESNDFLAVNQFTILENGIRKRPDLLLFINGLPLVMMELKNPAFENATIKSAFDQLQTYKQTIPSLCAYNCLMVISDGLEAKPGSLSAGFRRLMTWKTVDGKTLASHLHSELETLIRGQLNQKTLLDLIRHFIVFEKNKREDASGIITIETVKKVAAYHQYAAVNKAVERTIEAAGLPGDRKGGVVWHTQGSGKSLSMVFYTGKIVLILDNPTLGNIAQDIVSHFEKRQMGFLGKGMIVTMSRRLAVDLYNAIVQIRPEWHSDDLNKGAIKVIMTAASSDGPILAKHHTTKQQRRTLSERLKDPDDALQLVIVRDMWLTGFDAPSLHTMYIDKPMKGHNLMQAIARVNRVYKDKPGGLVVDYLGIAADLKEALSFYSDSGGKGDPTILQEQVVQLMAGKAGSGVADVPGETGSQLYGRFL